MKKYNWGIIGAGHIAQKFAIGLLSLENAVCYAVASRSIDKSKRFAKDNDFAKAYGSYIELLEDNNVDIVYIATPNSFHYEHVMMSLRAGKHVLCEKPFASNIQQAKEMFNEAKNNNLFLMEALGSSFLPSIINFNELDCCGAIGEATLLQADFGF